MGRDYSKSGQDNVVSTLAICRYISFALFNALTSYNYWVFKRITDTFTSVRPLPVMTKAVTVILFFFLGFCNNGQVEVARCGNCPPNLHPYTALAWPPVTLQEAAFTPHTPR